MAKLRHHRGYRKDGRDVRLLANDQATPSGSDGAMVSTPTAGDEKRAIRHAARISDNWTVA
jgi:hypothetical protein